MFTALGNGVSLLTTGNQAGTTLTVVVVVVVLVVLALASSHAASLAFLSSYLLILLLSLASAFQVAQGEVRLPLHTLVVVLLVVVVVLGNSVVPCQLVFGSVVVLVVLVIG